MWNYIQLTRPIPPMIPEADYFLKSINSPFFMNLIRCLAAGGAVMMLAAIWVCWKKDAELKKENKSAKEEG